MQRWRIERHQRANLVEVVVDLQKNLSFVGVAVGSL
jgi:hypothetical protein